MGQIMPFLGPAMDIAQRGLGISEQCANGHKQKLNEAKNWEQFQSFTKEINIEKAQMGKELSEWMKNCQKEILECPDYRLLDIGTMLDSLGKIKGVDQKTVSELKELGNQFQAKIYKESAHISQVSNQEHGNGNKNNNINVQNLNKKMELN